MSDGTDKAGITKRALGAIAAGVVALAGACAWAYEPFIGRYVDQINTTLADVESKYSVCRDTSEISAEQAAQTVLEIEAIRARFGGSPWQEHVVALLAPRKQLLNELEYQIGGYSNLADQPKKDLPEPDPQERNYQDHLVTWADAEGIGPAELQKRVDRIPPEARSSCLMAILGEKYYQGADRIDTSTRAKSGLPPWQYAQNCREARAQLGRSIAALNAATGKGPTIAAFHYDLALALLDEHRRGDLRHCADGAEPSDELLEMSLNSANKAATLDSTHAYARQTLGTIWERRAQQAGLEPARLLSYLAQADQWHSKAIEVEADPVKKPFFEIERGHFRARAAELVNEDPSLRLAALDWAKAAIHDLECAREGAVPRAPTGEDVQDELDDIDDGIAVASKVYGGRPPSVACEKRAGPASAP